MKYRFILSFAALLAAACVSAQTQVQLSPRQWANKAEVAAAKNETVTAIKAYNKALAGGYVSASLFYNQARLYAQRGEMELAFGALKQSINTGWYQHEEMRNDADLVPLHADPRWTTQLQKAQDNERDYRATHASPESFKFVTSDLSLFWNTYDKLSSSGDPAALFEREYLDQGTPGLHGFVISRISSGANLAKTIARYPKYYAAIRPATLQVAAVESTIRKSARKFKSMYPQALFPDVYFVIGALSSGGTATSEGLLIGTEMITRTDAVPIDELSPWLKAGTKSIDLLPNLVVHELMHFQQQYNGSDLLSSAIKEGAADFLASLISEGNFNAHIYTYGYANEATLKQEFLSDMREKNRARWLYNGSSSDGRPSDLGYFIGFRIVQAYYQKASDKQQAVSDILNVKDFERFVEQSAYFVPGD
ncbi:gliding motility protein GldB-related protein [Undibacterium parvum]|uniref:DUF2268 domain-containing protein n=1 Tax=Undibacterium parvum TaxID=401471 RepID=A0A3Q9BQ92_9BURK|nr:hypothetical protein [Undibacterium parvum]AZP11527.1 hypothetical protein EJN92_05645 [Undibacterium parvum]